MEGTVTFQTFTYISRRSTMKISLIAAVMVRYATSNNIWVWEYR